MKQESAQKLLGGHRHQPLLVLVGIIFPSEGDLALGDVDDPVIGDRDAVRVSGQILEDVLRPSEWSFGVNDPVIAIQRPKESVERSLFSQWFQHAREAKVPEAERPFQTGDKLAPKNTAQHFHRQEEGVPGVNPALMVRGEATGWDDAVYMRMRLKILPPRVEHAEEADLRTEVFRIGSNLQQRSGAGPEEKIINNLFVLQSQPREFVRDREDYMNVLHRQ